MTTLEFTATRSIAATQEKVWQAIVDPAKVAQYHLAPLRVIEPIKGGRISYGTDEAEMITGQILDIIPEKKLAHTFRFAPTQEGAKGDSETTVSYLIEAGDSGTKLTLTHSGFPDENQTYSIFQEGGLISLMHLKHSLRKNKPNKALHPTAARG